MKKQIFFILLGIIIILFVIYFSRENPEPNELLIIEPSISELNDYEVIYSDLEIPWDIVFLPDGEVLITERVGNVVSFKDNERVSINIPGVKIRGESGLLGMVLDPNFETNRYIYIYVTRNSGNGTFNNVERYKYENREFFDKTIIIENIPGAIYHDGGRLAFGPDGYLYVTTGDATQPDLSQDKTSKAGKILRVDKDNNYSIYSLGHRNPQGLAWDNENNLWITEHGRSGIKSGLDELNKIEERGNYGWPIYQGDDNKEGYVSPVIHSGNDTWAPASLVYFNEAFYFGGLRGEAIYKYKNGILTEHYKNTFGRIRSIVVHDNFLYILTSNRDGRGKIFNGDDKVIRFNVSF